MRMANLLHIVGEHDPTRAACELLQMGRLGTDDSFSRATSLESCFRTLPVAPFRWRNGCRTSSVCLSKLFLGLLRTRMHGTSAPSKKHTQPPGMLRVALSMQPSRPRCCALSPKGLSICPKMVMCVRKWYFRRSLDTLLSKRLLRALFATAYKQYLNSFPKVQPVS